MAASNVKLLGAWASPYVNRVQLALQLKSIEYEFIEENPYDKSELLLTSNPVHKKIPVLIHYDKPICESLVIVQYINDAWANGPSILPSHPHDRAVAQFWASFINDKWFPLFKELRQARGEGEKEEVIHKISEGLNMLEEACISCSKGKDFFNGDNIGYIDIVLGCYLGWMRATEIVAEVKLLDVTKIPGLVKWAERFSSYDAVRKVVPETQTLVDLYKKFLAVGR
ncbi:hypothetical protein Pfo_024083 [Paulownia fortunei]|nr:hypothetical protein Pfo_024083 [Paulownia fortunei]